MTLTEIIDGSGLKRSHIARQAGISKQQLWLMETGKARISDKYIADLSRVLHVSPATLRPDLAKLFNGQEGR